MLPVLILTAKPAFAQSSSSIAQPTKKMIVESDYILRLDNGDLQQRSLSALAGLGKELQFSMNSFVTGTQPPVQINNIQIQLAPADIHYQADGLGILFQASQLRAAVTVGEIKVDQVVEKDLGGVIARIQVSATCRGVQLQFADPSAVASARFLLDVVDEELRLKVEAAQVQMGTPSLNVSSLSCEGAQGFDELIRAELVKAVGDTKAFQDFIHEQYLQRLQKTAADFHYNWHEPKKAFADEKLQAWIYPQSIHFVPGLNAWFNQGRLQMIPTGATQRSTQVFHFAKPELVLTAQEQPTALLLPENFVLEVIGQYFNQSSFVIIKKSTDIPAFQSLMGSFFAKLFLWPDLLFFKKSTDFLFIGDLSTEPVLSWPAKGLRLQVALPLRVDMRYAMNSKYLPFVRFNVPTTATMPISVVGDQILLQGQNVTMDLDYEYDPQYCESQNNACGSISKKTLKKSLQDFAGHLSSQIPLPQMEIFSGVVVKSQGLQRDPAMGAVIFSLK